MALVLDVPSLLQWYFTSENEEKSAEFLGFLESGTIHTNATWNHEARAILLEAEEAHIIDAADTAGVLEDLKALSFETGTTADPDAVTALARKHQLPLSQAASLAEASRLGLPLLTLNPGLASAARSEGIKTL